MNIEELKAMIPSETVRQYIMDTGWTFTDVQKAALLYHGDLPLEQQYFRLRGLRDKTEDDVLREQITEFLSCKEQGHQAFKENGDKSHIYALLIDYFYLEERGGRGYDEGYFFDWTLAYERGKQEGCPFRIEKYIICDVNKPSEGSGCPVAEFSFNECGEATDFWSREVPFIKMTDDHFTFVSYEVPNPFERGDVVRVIGTKDYGIVETGQKNPLKWNDRIRVVVLYEDGDFCSKYFNSMNLELYNPKEDEAEGWNPMALLLQRASELYKDGGSFDELVQLIGFYIISRYKN